MSELYRFLISSLQTVASACGHDSPHSRELERYKARIYDKVIFAEIEAWARLRNQVDHGDFTGPADIDTGAAKRMVDGVRQFVLKYR